MIRVASVSYDSGTGMFGNGPRLTVEVEDVRNGEHVVSVDDLPERFVEALRDWLKP